MTRQVIISVVIRGSVFPTDTVASSYKIPAPHLYHHQLTTMPPKGKKTKAEEALDFLSNLDNLDAPDTSDPPPTGDTPRDSTDSTRKSLTASRELPSKTTSKSTAEDEEAESALAFLNAQINQKRAKPLSDSRAGTPLSAAGSSTAAGAASTSTPKPKTPAEEPINTPTETPAPAQSSGGWGSSFWSTATSALQSAQRVADEQYQKVKSEGVNGVTGQLENLRANVKSVPGVDLNKLRKGAEERLGGFVRGVDLDKIRTFQIILVPTNADGNSCRKGPCQHYHLNSYHHSRYSCSTHLRT